MSKKTGGPNVRIHRMKKRFGQNLINPNIVYAGSFWSKENLEKLLLLKQKHNFKIVFNQNGWYYPGWYKGDAKSANELIWKVQQASSYVIYQSQFCLDSQLELIGQLPGQYKIVYNSIPYSFKERKQTSKIKRQCLLAGVFHADASHIWIPFIKALEILKAKNNVSTEFVIAGYFTPEAQKTDWFKEIADKIELYKTEGILNFLGSYKAEDFTTLFEDIDFALHLVDKDPCPNAVIERMSLGIPHIYVSSGGTKELIADAGIPLPVEHSWEQKCAIDPHDLAHAILEIQASLFELSEKTKERYSRIFNWNQYIAEHQNIFNQVLRDQQ